MGYYVKLRRNGRICGKLGPFTTKKLAIKQAQPLADDAAPDVTVTVEPESNPKAKSKPKKKAKAKRHKHDWAFVRSTPRHHRRTGKPLGTTITQRCASCGKRRDVDSETGRAIRRNPSLSPAAQRMLKSFEFAIRSRSGPNKGRRIVKTAQTGNEGLKELLKKGMVERVGPKTYALVESADGANPRRRNYSPVPGSPRLASATDSLVDWTPMNARTAANMERMGMAPRRANPDPTSVQTPAGVVHVGDTVEGRLNMGGKVKIKVAHIDQYGPRYKVGGSGSWVWADRITRIVSRKKNTRRRNAKRATPPAMDAGQLKLF
jgi:hypothetical protein